MYSHHYCAVIFSKHDTTCTRSYCRRHNSRHVSANPGQKQPDLVTTQRDCTCDRAVTHCVSNETGRCTSRLMLLMEPTQTSAMSGYLRARSFTCTMVSAVTKSLPMSRKPNRRSTRPGTSCTCGGEGGSLVSALTAIVQQVGSWLRADHQKHGQQIVKKQAS